MGSWCALVFKRASSEQSETCLCQPGHPGEAKFKAAQGNSWLATWFS